MNTLVLAGLAALLGLGTVVGVSAALTSNSADRATPASSAPVYGTP